MDFFTTRTGSIVASIIISNFTTGSHPAFSNMFMKQTPTTFTSPCFWMSACTCSFVTGTLGIASPPMMMSTLGRSVAAFALTCMPTSSTLWITFAFDSSSSGTKTCSGLSPRTATASSSTNGVQVPTHP